MSARAPTVDEVYAALLERIGTGAIEEGSKLPSCRLLAAELGSNPSTVNRALRRLTRHGLVRTEPRVGSFLVHAGASPELGRTEVENAIREATLSARRSGLSTDRIRELFESSLAIGSNADRRIAFVECNESDLSRMSQLVQDATGMSLIPLLIDELDSGWEEMFDVVAAPMFHLGAVVRLSVDVRRVVEVNFVPSSDVLRDLATIESTARVAVTAPTMRGLERMRALVSQYHEGDIVAVDPANTSELAGADVVVHPTAIRLDASLRRSVGREIVIDWVLDPASAAAFPGRVAAALPR